MYNTKKYKLGLLIFFCFFSLASLGTLFHELGHYTCAKMIGLDPLLHYGSTSINKKGLNFFEKLVFYSSGPLTNMGIGSIGLYFLKKSKKKGDFENSSILFISIVFFWSRQVVILISDLLFSILNPDILNIKLSDEQKISILLKMPIQSVSIFFGLLGAFVCIYSVFFLIDLSLRLDIIMYGFLGCIGGIYLWYAILGPIILP